MTDEENLERIKALVNANSDDKELIDLLEAMYMSYVLVKESQRKQDKP